MDKFYYFPLLTECILPKWLKDVYDQCEHLLSKIVNNILEDTRDAESIFVDSEEEGEEREYEGVIIHWSYFLVIYPMFAAS